jgi:hypothetical protein
VQFVVTRVFPFSKGEKVILILAYEAERTYMKIGSVFYFELNRQQRKLRVLGCYTSLKIEHEKE